MRRAPDHELTRRRPEPELGHAPGRTGRGPMNHPSARGRSAASGKGHLIEENWDFPGSASSVREARDRSRAFLEGRVPEDVRDDAVLVLSELATNAVLHTGGDYSVHVEFDVSEVLVSVSDAGGGRVAPDDAAPSAVSGRGLRIVEAVSSSWGCRSEPAGKTVWARLRTPASLDGVLDAPSSARI
jgi:anti-sigma regulatory factor (Ser/Thr protein kinase)